MAVTINITVFWNVISEDNDHSLVKSGQSVGMVNKKLHFNIRIITTSSRRNNIFVTGKVKKLFSEDG